MIFVRQASSTRNTRTAMLTFRNLAEARKRDLLMATEPDFSTRLTNAVWADLHTADDYPAVRPLLAHYTSVANLEKIVINNELWLSNPLYMNDWEELRFGMSEGAARFRISDVVRQACGTPEIHAELVSYFDDLYRQFDEKHALDIYVLCLSEHDKSDTDGVLSMWRGYGSSGSGVALVFDTNELDPVEPSPFILSKVIYASKVDRLAWINAKLDAMAAVIAGSSLSSEQLNYLAYSWFERLKVFSLFTKHDGFAEEKEWRIVYLRDRDPSSILGSMLSYAVMAKGVEAKLKLRLGEIQGLVSKPISIDSIIAMIILGPTISSVLAASSIRRMLEVARPGSLAEKLVASSIPFRT